MAATTTMSADSIRAAAEEKSNLRARDLADALGISEAQLVAARGATKISAEPDTLIPRIEALGEVMALTRTPSVVHEKVGVYDNYRPGDHAAMVLNEAIDLRIFPSQWVHAYAVSGENGRRSIQVFDAAGDAVHKVHAREATNLGAWDRLVADLRLGEQPETLIVADRAPVEAPKGDPAKADQLRAEWDKMTDTHQFMRITSRLKMNRLGAYRMAGAPYAVALAPEALNEALKALAGSDIPIMLFVGNRGCIQIHGGSIHQLKEMGPWQNVMDPGFNLHLRLDHVAEVWAVQKPTRRGMAYSIEAFDAEGWVITQIFGMRRGDEDHVDAFKAVMDGLSQLTHEEA